MLLSADDRWYQTAFGPLTAAFWTALIPRERVLAEARFIAGALKAPPGGLLLDLPCGAGRHARALGQLGYRVEGFDVSEHMLASSPDGPVEGVTLRLGEMGALAATERYDGCLCWGNSFGYLPDEENRAFFGRVARALEPGARFVLECAAVAEAILGGLQPRTEHAAAGYRFTAERRYDMRESALHIRYRIEHEGVAEQFVARQAVYTSGEIVRMAAAAGLGVEALHGGIGGEPAALGRPLVAVFRKA